MSAKQQVPGAAAREAAATIPVYGQLPFVPARAEGCDIITEDGRRILDFYGGHAVAALGYGHEALVKVISEQSASLLFQSNAVALDIRAEAAEKLVGIAPARLTNAFFVNSGAEANENALRIACRTTGRRKVLAIEHGFHGRTAAAGAVTWKSAGRWYGFPDTPFDVDFIPRDDVEAARNMIDDSVAAVIFEPVQGVAGAYDLSASFVQALRDETARAGAILIADEVQSGMGRTGHFFAVQHSDVEPDILTAAKSLGGGIPCGALLTTKALSAELQVGDLGTTFGGGPLASAAIVAVIDAIHAEGLLDNVHQREAEIHDQCLTGPVTGIQGKGFLTGLVCDRPARDVRNALLDRDILTGTSADPAVLRLLPPLVLEAAHVKRLAAALNDIA
jgi:acetylornithine/succinyldiaminopimelate/putrescine aminotransferase